MRREFCCIVIISILLVSVAPVLVWTSQKDVTKDVKLGNVHVDASAVLRDLGYTEENMSTVSRKLMLQITRSYHAKAEFHDDGDYYVVITPDSPRTEINLIGSDKISPYDIDLSQPPDSRDVSYSKGIKESSLDSEERECLVFAIWDYPGTEIDIPDAEDEFDHIADWISSTSAYDYWNFLTNSESTHYYISAWITWACAAYDNVDIYWNGHGIEFMNDAAFLSYDAWDDDEGVITSNLYVEDDFETGTYDYSTLRVGSGSFCYGWGFHETFLNPGGSTSHNRAFMGSDTEIALAYTTEYIDTWGEYEGSYYSHFQARAAAAPYLGQGQNHFSYNDNTGSIWYR